MSVYSSNRPILYRGKHKLSSVNGVSSVRVITIYKPLEPPLEELYITLTDDSNPFILFSMKLLKSDFIVMKNTQSLTSEFSSFPQQLTSLLEQTNVENTKMYVSIDGEVRSVTLSVKEESTIKHVTHLSLRLLQADDTEVTDKVLNFITQLQGNLKTKEKSLKDMTNLFNEKLQNREEEIKDLKEKCIQQRAELESDLSSLSRRKEMEMNETVSALHRNYQEKLNFAKTENENMSQNIKSLEAEKNELLKGRDILRTRLADTTTKLENVTSEHNQLQKSFKTLQIRLNNNQQEFIKKQNSIDVLQKEKSQLEELVHSAKIKEMDLQLQLNTVLDRNRNLIQENSQANMDLRVLDYKHRELEERYMEACSDLKKANQIIANLQNDLELIKKQKIELKAQLSEILVKMTNLQEHCKQMETKTKSYEKKLSEYDEQRKTKNTEVQALKNQKLNLQNTVSHLYKELTDIKQGKLHNIPSSSFRGSDKITDSFYYKKFFKESDISLNATPLIPTTVKVQPPKQPASNVGTSDSLSSILKKALDTAPQKTDQDSSVDKRTSEELPKPDLHKPKSVEGTKSSEKGKKVTSQADSLPTKGKNTRNQPPKPVTTASEKSTCQPQQGLTWAGLTNKIASKNR